MQTRLKPHENFPQIGVLNVELGTRAYPIYIGENILNNSELFQDKIRGKQICIVTNETIAPIYLDQLKNNLDKLNLQITTVILPDGEKYKNLNILENIFNELLTARHARDTTLIALGGGVIGDMTGFAAACYQRGVAFIQIPTTLLSQVDSSVGGKTGVNHPLGKNMLGAFHQPQMVLADTATLKTLPPRELAAGLAEVVKYGLLGDLEFLIWLENNIENLLQCESFIMQTAIARSCQNKADIVARDEHETGERALLNLGHTFGHAIETFTRYETWLHGEAVGAGMVMAAEFSAKLGWISAADAARAKKLIAACGLPVRPPEAMRAQDFLNLMKLDKKVKSGQVRLVLLKTLGEAILTAEYDGEKLQAFLVEWCGG